MNIVDWFAPLCIGLYGLFFGSFANVVIWRLPRGESLSTPGSHCPSCSAPIAWRDNIPVVSWIVLRARCRHCGETISARYPLVELLCSALWLLMWFLYGLTVALAFAIAFTYLLMLLSFIDLDTMRLPNVLVALLAGVGVAGLVVYQLTGVPAAPLLTGTGALSNPWAFAAAGVVIGGLVPFLLSEAYAAVRGSAGMGMGDVKLLGAMGLYLGPYVLMALLFGSVAGALSAVLLPQHDGLRRKIPFGPFLALGWVVCLVCGPQLWEWYGQFL